MVSQLRLVESGQYARALAATLNEAKHGRPVVVVTTARGRKFPYIDAAAIHADLGDLAEVYLLTTGRLSDTFTAEMAEGTQVYGGAGRAYPVGLEWVHNPSRAPLRLARNEHDGARATEALVLDALGMAATAGLVGYSHNAPTLVSGTVRNLVAGRAIVRLENGRNASIATELVSPGVPIERLVAQEMIVSGYPDDMGRLDVRSTLLSCDTIPYRTGDVVLALVDGATKDRAQLALHPQLVVEVAHDDVTSNELDDVDTLLTPGEVLRARVVATGPWALRLCDLDDDETAIPAVPLLVGGPPWLVEGLPVPKVQEELAAPPAAPVGVSSTVTAVPQPRPKPSGLSSATRDHARQATASTGRAHRTAPIGHVARARCATLESVEAEQLRIELTRVQTALDNTHREIEGCRKERALFLDARDSAEARSRRLEGELSQARRKLRAARRHPPEDAPGRWFTDPEDQFRYEVHASWVRRVPAEEKAQWPLQSYEVGPEFFDSLRNLQGVSHSKVLEVVVDVLTGRAARVSSRQLHQLRSSKAGCAKPRTRDDGAICWRVALQERSPSARRLHFWQLTDRTLELSRVVVHDDYSP